MKSSRTTEESQSKIPKANVPGKIFQLTNSQLIISHLTLSTLGQSENFNIISVLNRVLVRFKDFIEIKEMEI